MMELSIIVPIYQVEEYIRPCIESIFIQGLDEEAYEIILVNDGTRDKSIEKIDDFIKSHSNIKVIEQENKGLSAARNIGVEHAVGKYILFVDSDDLLIEHSLCLLVEDIKKHTPDLLVAGFVKKDNNEIESHIIHEQTDYHSRTTTGSDAFVNFFNPRQCYVWRFLFRRDFLLENQIMFIPGIYFEDIPYTTECYLKADKCVITDHTFYIYRQRPDSILSSLNTKKLTDFNSVIKRLWEMRDWDFKQEEKSKLMYVIFSTFSIELWYMIYHDHLYAERKIILEDLKQQVPELYFSGSIKLRIISFCYHHIPYAYLSFRRNFEKVIRHFK